MGIDLSGSTAAVTKHMASDPRRISKIEVTLEMAVPVDGKSKAILERTGLTCPVHHSLHPDLEQAIVFNWKKHE
jgi:hypothetical protein